MLDVVLTEAYITQAPAASRSGRRLLGRIVAAGQAHANDLMSGRNASVVRVTLLPRYQAARAREAYWSTSSSTALADGSLAVEPVVTHVFPVTDVLEAFTVAAAPSVSGKVLLEF